MRSANKERLGLSVKNVTSDQMSAAVRSSNSTARIRSRVGHSQTFQYHSTNNTQYLLS